MKSSICVGAACRAWFACCVLAGIATSTAIAESFDPAWVGAVSKRIGEFKDRPQCVDHEKKYPHVHILGVRGKSADLSQKKQTLLVDQLTEKLFEFKNFRLTAAPTFQYIAESGSLGNDELRRRLTKLDRDAQRADIVILLSAEQVSNAGGRLATRIWTNNKTEAGCQGVVTVSVGSAPNAPAVKRTGPPDIAPGEVFEAKLGTTVSLFSGEYLFSVTGWRLGNDRKSVWKVKSTLTGGGRTLYTQHRLGGTARLKSRRSCVVALVNIQQEERVFLFKLQCSS